MAWIIPVAIVAGALGLYAMLKEDKPKCPYCKAFVVRNSNRCNRCGAPLKWR